MPNYVFLISRRQITVSENNLQFENFSSQDSAELFHSLYENWIEILKMNLDQFSIISFLHEADALTAEQSLTENHQVEIINDKNLSSVLKNKLEKFDIHNFPKIIFIFADSIGISSKDFYKYFNVLDNDDNNLLLVRDTNDNICLFGINYYNDSLIENLFYNDLKADKFLKQFKTQDFFLFMFDGMLQLNSLDDFKMLYKVLSTKESIEFCSQEMHEKFTHLFIEYKELL
ncbi:MAG: hypothetical protein C4539_19135 [Ignavibacteriales bacterium]|nr:MAG: hypothetical protein C4539_19135 [Ignavibacteriales bacterium]